MRTSLYPACSSSFFSCACFVDQVSPCDELWAKASWGKVKEITANTPACSRSRFSGWISGWRGGLLIHWRWQPAVVLLIHWRWQPTGGAIYFL